MIIIVMSMMIEIVIVIMVDNYHENNKYYNWIHFSCSKYERLFILNYITSQYYIYIKWDLSNII